MVAPFAHYDQTSIHGSKFAASTNTRSHRKDFVTDASGMSRIEPYSRSPFSLPAGWVDPGLICSIFARARSIFLMISSTVDRKSTRLNSSHGYISYAVFCLKKKKKNNSHYHKQYSTSVRSHIHMHSY